MYRVVSCDSRPFEFAMKIQPTVRIYGLTQGITQKPNPKKTAILCAALFDAMRVILMQECKVDIDDTMVFFPVDLWPQSHGEKVLITIAGLAFPYAFPYDEIARKIALAVKDLLPGRIQIRVLVEAGPIGESVV